MKQKDSTKQVSIVRYIPSGNTYILGKGRQWHSTSMWMNFGVQREQKNKWNIYITLSYQFSRIFFNHHGLINYWFDVKALRKFSFSSLIFLTSVNRIPGSTIKIFTSDCVKLIYSFNIFFGRCQTRNTRVCVSFSMSCLLNTHTHTCL